MSSSDWASPRSTLAARCAFPFVTAVAIVPLLFAGGCGGGAGGGPDGGSVSYARDIAPIFQAHCVYCHHTGSVIDVDLQKPFDPKHGIINRPNSWVPQGSKDPVIVDPGNPGDSFILVKVGDPSLDMSVNGKPMPYQVPRVTDTELANIKQWITNGAADDAFFQNNVAPIFGTALSLGRTAGKCTWCHYPGSPTGMNVLNVFDPKTGMVNVDSIYGKKIVAPGDVAGSLLIDKITSMNPPGAPMPFHPARLTSAQIGTLRAWIAEGAPNN